MQLIERDARAGSACQRRVALLALPVFDDVPRLCFVGNLEVVSRLRHPLQTQHFYRRGGRRVFHRAPVIVKQRAHFAEHRSANEEIARPQSPVLHENRRHWAAAFVDTRFQHCAGRRRIRIRFQLAQVGYQQQSLQQLFDSGFLFR